MGNTTLRSQRALVVIGFVSVGVSGLGQLGYASPSAHNQEFFWIVTAIGFGLLGWASSGWLAALSRNREGVPGMGRVLRLFAVACVVLGVAYLGLINEIVELHRRHIEFGIRRQAAMDILSLLGFALAALGFWTAAHVVKAAASTSTPEHATRESRQAEPTTL